MTQTHDVEEEYEVDVGTHDIPVNAGQERITVGPQTSDAAAYNLSLFHAENGIRIHDPAFRDALERLDGHRQKRFLQAVTRISALRAAENIATAFWMHDQPIPDRYDTAQHFFRNAFHELYDVGIDDAEQAAGGEVYALKYHDVVEDDFDSLHAYGSFDHPGNRFTVEDGELLSLQEIFEHPMWHDVRTGFGTTADTLDLPELITYRDENVGPYGMEGEKFYLWHSAARETRPEEKEQPATNILHLAEDEDVLDTIEWGPSGYEGFAERVTAGEFCRKMMIGYADRAQALFITPLVTEDEVRDHYLNRYKQAIYAHDRYSEEGHPREEIDKNTAIMKDAYTPVLLNAVYTEHNDLIPYDTMGSFFNEMGYGDIL